MAFRIEPRSSGKASALHAEPISPTHTPTPTYTHIESYYVAQAGLELALWTRLVLNSQTAASEGLALKVCMTLTSETCFAP